MIESGRTAMKTKNIVLLILVIILTISVLGFILSLVGAITGLIWRFIFSPLGVITLIVLVVYLIKRQK